MLLANPFFSVAAFTHTSADTDMGIVANVIGLGFFVPTICVFLSLISVVGLQIWYILIARGLFMLAQSGSLEAAKRI